MPYFSVIIPVYNVAPCLWEFMESALTQMFCDRELESGIGDCLVRGFDRIDKIIK